MSKWRRWSCSMLSIEEARRFYEGAEAVHDFEHVLRVLALAERIGQAEGADLDVIRAAVLLHDTHRIVEDEQGGGDHAELAAVHAREVLRDEAPAFVEAVAHAIHAHRFRNAVQPQTLEAKCVFDADKLDSIGAVGVARAVAFGALHGQRLWGEVPPDYDGWALGDEHTPHHEFRYKLAKVKDRMQTETGRRLAEGRHRFMVAFFDQMAEEVAGRA